MSSQLEILRSRQMSDMWKQIIVPTLSLFTSFGTLICCALPALFVSLGMGAVLAGLVSDLPWLIVLSEHKKEVFGIAIFMLSIATFLHWKMRYAPCPADPQKARACQRMRHLSKWVLALSWVLFAVGFFFAFLAAS